MGQVLYSPAKEYRIMEGQIEKRRHPSPDKKLFIPDCSPSTVGLQSEYRRGRIRIWKDGLRSAVRYSMEYGVEWERAKSVKPVV